MLSGLSGPKNVWPAKLLYKQRNLSSLLIDVTLHKVIHMVAHIHTGVYLNTHVLFILLN